MSERILVLNPGSTSTKVAVFQDGAELFMENVRHTDAELSNDLSTAEQLTVRMQAVDAALDAHGIEKASLQGVVGRGGLIPGLETGAYGVNQAMKDALLGGALFPHASNLGALMADSVAGPLGIPAIIYDAVSADDLPEKAKITGIPEIRRQSFCHVLNSRAMARKYAASVGKRYEDVRLLVAHLGGGVSISAHADGKIIDVIADDAGPFSPERAGSIPVLYIIDMCFSGKYTKEQIIRKQRGNGGMKAWLGTSDCQKIESRIAAGDELAALIYEAQAYQIAKGVGNLAPALSCHMDAIILTGGVANSRMLTDKVKGYLGDLAPIVIMPGEFEMEALAAGMARVLHGEERAKVYVP